MTVSLRLLFGLPPSVRCQVFSRGPTLQWQLTGLRHSPNLTQARAFRATPRSLAVKPSRPPRPRVTKPQAPPSAPIAKPRLNIRNRHDNIDTIEPTLDKVLLYVSPNHGAFFATSYICSVILFIGGVTYASLTLRDDPDVPKEQRLPWYSKALGAIVVLSFAMMGCRIWLSPAKMIKSVCIVKVPGVAAAAPTRQLQFEVKRALPFLRPDILETDPSKVFVNRSLGSSVGQLNCISVDRIQAQSFTEQYFSGKWRPRDSQGGIVNIWPAIKRDTKRMMLRDQMAYVRIEPHGNFKLDMQGFAVLDGGRPLSALMKLDNVVPSLKSLIARYM